MFPLDIKPAEMIEMVKEMKPEEIQGERPLLFWVHRYLNVVYDARTDKAGMSGKRSSDRKSVV